MNTFKDGFQDILKSFREVSYKSVFLWGFLGSLYTTVLLLSSGYLIDLYASPLSGYIIKSLVSGLVYVPLFISAYLLAKGKKITSFFQAVKDYYLWSFPVIFLSLLSGVLMIFFNNIMLFILPLLVIFFYTIFCGLVPFYIEQYGLHESYSLSLKTICKSIKRVIPTVIFNSLFLVLIFQGLNLIALFSMKENLYVGFILNIVLSLIKPLLYALPLFNALTTSMRIIKGNEKTENIKEEKIGDII